MREKLKNNYSVSSFFYKSVEIIFQDDQQCDQNVTVERKTFMNLEIGEQWATWLTRL